MSVQILIGDAPLVTEETGPQYWWVRGFFPGQSRWEIVLLWPAPEPRGPFAVRMGKEGPGCGRWWLHQMPKAEWSGPLTPPEAAAQGATP